MFLALAGLLAGLVIGVIVSRIVASGAHPSLAKALGFSTLTMVSLVGIIGATGRLMADVPPTVDGETLMLVVGARWPATGLAHHVMQDIPIAFQDDVNALPPAPRDLLNAERAAGNEVCAVTHTHPAPPVGAGVMLVRPVTTRPRKTGDGLRFRDVNGSLYSGQFTDSDERYFILEAPLPPPEEPDMDAIRAANDAPRPREAEQSVSPVVDAFRASMVVDYDKWHDGIGYGIDGLQAASDSEKAAITALLVPPRGWRDVEALAALGTDVAESALRKAIDSGSAEVRAAVLRYAPQIATDEERTALLMKALQHGTFYQDLTGALDLVATFHPPRVMNALFRGLFVRPGDIATHFAAMLAFIYGKTTSTFDWDMRPLFLKFNSDDGAERRRAFDTLCALLEIDPVRTLATIGEHNEE